MLWQIHINKQCLGKLEVSEICGWDTSYTKTQPQLDLLCARTPLGH